MAKKTIKRQKPNAKSQKPAGDLRSYSIRDTRLEKPSFELSQVRVGDEVRYEVKSGDLSRPAPPSHGNSPRKSLQAGTSRWRRLFRTWAGGLLLRLGFCSA